jgi:hypothetical protein
MIFGNLNMSRAKNIEYIQDDCTANAVRYIERRNFEFPVVAQWEIFEELRARRSATTFSIVCYCVA